MSDTSGYSSAMAKEDFWQVAAEGEGNASCFVTATATIICILSNASTANSGISDVLNDFWEFIKDLFSKDSEVLTGNPGDIIYGPETYKKTHIGEDGKADAQQHNTHHNNPKTHKNPHWHKIDWSKGYPKFEPGIPGEWPFIAP